MSNKSCGFCSHWSPERPAGNQGMCQAHPPSVTSLLVPGPPSVSQPNGTISIQNASAWPVTQANQSCGEYNPKIPLLN